jgi:hypothetical protein
LRSLQALVAIGFIAGKFCIGFGADQLRLRLLDGGLLLGDLAFGGLDVGIAGIDGRILLRQQGLVIAQVDAHQRITGLHMLVVDDIDLIDVTIDARGDGHRIGAKIGIVRGLDVLAVNQPPHPIGNADQGENGQNNEEHGADAPIAIPVCRSGGRGLCGCGRYGRSGGWRISHGES